MKVIIFILLIAVSSYGQNFNYLDVFINGKLSSTNKVKSSFTINKKYIEMKRDVYIHTYKIKKKRKVNKEITAYKIQNDFCIYISVHVIIVTFIDSHNKFVEMIYHVRQEKKQTKVHHVLNPYIRISNWISKKSFGNSFTIFINRNKKNLKNENSKRFFI